MIAGIFFISEITIPKGFKSTFMSKNELGTTVKILLTILKDTVMKTKRVLTFLTLMILPFTFLIGCSDDDDNGGTNPPEDMETSFVRVGHLSPDAPAVDIWVDGAVVLEDVEFNEFSAYLELEAGEHQIQVSPANATEPIVIDATVNLDAEIYYSVIAGGFLNGNSNPINATVLVDSRTTDGSTSKVRFVHMSPDAPSVDIYTVGGTTPLFESVSFGESASYINVPGSPVALEVRAAGSEDAVIRFSAVTLENGKNYTVFARGLLEPGVTDNLLGATAVVDAPGSGNMVISLMTEEAETASVRVGHLVPDAPAVDVYVDDMLVLEDVPFKTFSSYLEVSAGMRTVKVTPADDANTVVIEKSLNVEADQGYTIAAMGLLNDNSLDAYAFMDNWTTDASNAQVRFIHASPNAPGVDVSVRGGDVVFDNVDFLEAADWISVPSGSYNFNVDLSATGDRALYLDDVALSANMNYTVFAVGLAGDEQMPLEAIATVDAPGEGGAVVSLMSRNPKYASVRVAHLSEDAPAVDIYVSGSMVAEDVSYEQFTPWLSVLAGEPRTIEVFVSGTNTNAVIDAELTFDADMSYTVAATGLLGDGSFGPQVFSDSQVTMGSMAKVRFVHTGADAPEVDITLEDGTPLFSNIAFNEAADYLTVDASSYTLQVRVAGTETVVLTFADVPLSAGMNYSVFATGTLAENSLGAIVTVDAPGTGDEVINLEAAMAEARVAHLSPDAPNVDIAINGERVLLDVPYEAVSDYLMLYAKTTTIEVYVAGSSSMVSETTITPMANKSYTIAATGEPSTDFQFLVIEDIRTASGNGDAWVRFVHTSPDAPAVDVRVAGGPTLFENISFREFGDYLSVGAGEYDLEVVVHGTETVALEVNGVMFDSNTNYTIFATGLAGDGSLGALPVVDNE